MFLLTTAFPRLFPALMLVPSLILQRPWTLVSYMFLHAGFWHLAFNMIALYFFGPQLERRLGERHFIGLYATSGLMGALLSLIFTPGAAIVGASGAIFGVMLGFARYWPRAPIYIWGILPIEARWFVIGMTLLSLFGGRVQPGVAHFAHLGGFAGGFLYLTWLDRRRRGAFQSWARPAPVQDVEHARERWGKIRLDDLHPVNRQEVERLLRKVEQQGTASLTLEERSVLDRFSAR